MTATVAIDVSAHCARRDRNCCGGSEYWTSNNVLKPARKYSLERNCHGMRSLAGGRCVMMMILAVFHQRVRVRADTPRGVVPPKQVATTAKLRNYNLGFGAVHGPAPGVFVRMTPNRLALRRRCLLLGVTTPA